MLSDQDDIMLSKVPSDIRQELRKHLEDKNKAMEDKTKEMQDTLRTVKLAEEAVLSACGRLMRSGRSDFIDDQMSSQCAPAQCAFAHSLRRQTAVSLAHQLFALLGARKRLEHELMHGPLMGEQSLCSTNGQETSHSRCRATMTQSCRHAIMQCHLLIGLQDAMELTV